MAYSYIPRINQPNTPNLSSLQLSSRWAIDAARGTIPQMANPMRIHTAGQLAGTHFFSGRVNDPQSQRYNDLMTARTIAAGGTLNAYHVNLESNVGQYLKQSMDLPFQQHSRVDPKRAAIFAERLFTGVFGKGQISPSVAENEALRSYTNFPIFNSYLRSGTIGGPRADPIKHLTGLIGKANTGRKLGVWRGAPASVFAGADPSTLVGQEFTEKGFMSTSLFKSEAEGFVGQGDTKGYLLKLQVPQGHPALPVARYAMDEVREPGEILLPPGTKYKITKAWEEGGYHRLLGEVLPVEKTIPPPVLGNAIGAPVRSTMEATEKIAAKETLHELHTNLESGVGQFLKKLMRLPFKGHSRVDPMAAAQSSPIEDEVAGKFTGKALTIGGLVLAGALTIGYAMGHHKSDGTQVSKMSHTERPDDRKHHEHTMESTNSRNQGRRPPKTRTTLSISDHPWDMKSIDMAYANKLKHDWAHSQDYS